MSAGVTVLSAVIGVLAGGVVTYLTSRSQLRIEAEHAYDQALRDLRLPHYQELFHLTRSIPRKWQSFETPQRADVMKYRAEFHEWYFNAEASGMFLSQAGREAYFGLQHELEAIGSRLTLDREEISDRDSVVLRQLASALRHQLTGDLGTAERPRRTWTAPRSIAPPA